MKILYKQVGYPAMVKIIKDDPESMWSVLDGYIEMLPLGGDLWLVHSDNGEDPHLIADDGNVICGNVVVTAREYSEFRDLTEEEIRTAIEVLEEMEL